MPAPEQTSDSGPKLLEVGRITKAHGLAGEVVVFLITDRKERVAPGSILSSPRGPLTVERSRPHQDRWIVKFEQCSSREQAEQMNGTPLSAEPVTDDDVLWVHELIGKAVFTPDGTRRGEIELVIDAPSSDLLQLDNGALVPVAFVVSEPAAEQVIVDTPDGLFELFEE